MKPSNCPSEGIKGTVKASHYGCFVMIIFPLCSSSTQENLNPALSSAPKYQLLSMWVQGVLQPELERPENTSRKG